jgi:hypothetical protein
MPHDRAPSSVSFVFIVRDRSVEEPVSELALGSTQRRLTTVGFSMAQSHPGEVPVWKLALANNAP